MKSEPLYMLFQTLEHSERVFTAVMIFRKVAAVRHVLDNERKGEGFTSVVSRLWQPPTRSESASNGKTISGQEP